jgi:flagellar biosynthetic protein FliP
VTAPVESATAHRGAPRLAVALLVGLVVLLGLLFGPASPATAATETGYVTVLAAPDGGAVLAAPDGGAVLAAPEAPATPATPAQPGATTGDAGISVQVNGPDGKPSSSIMTILLLTVLSVAPAILLMCTSFTKIFVVLSLTRNALGLTAVPPNQVLAGLALFISLFVMGPVLSDVNDAGVQPYLKGDKTQSVAFNDGVKPLREFMLKHTREEEIALFTKAAGNERPQTRADVPLTTLIPSFVISELRAAFIIGFVIYIPFLVIDLVVSASLMALGMMMLPPVTVSLPFKLLLFVLVNGWGLIVTALVSSYQ